MTFLIYRRFSLQKNTHIYTYIVVINSQCVFMDSMLVNMPIDERRKKEGKNYLVKKSFYYKLIYIIKLDCKGVCVRVCVCLFF